MRISVETAFLSGYTIRGSPRSGLGLRPSQRREEGSEMLKTGGLTALPALTYPRTYPDHTNYDVL